MIAIVIPYYKIEFFSATLRSLASQTDQRFRVYIGNDASHEDPEDLINQFKGKFDFTYHRFDENLGSLSLPRHWQRCIDLTVDEEWIMILGDDDRLGSNVIKEFYKSKINYSNGFTNLVRFATQSFDAENDQKSNVFNHETIEKVTDSFMRKYYGVTRSSLSEYIFARNIYLEKKFKNYPLAWYSDDYAWLDFSDGKPLLSINNAIVTVNISNQSITGSRNNIDQKLLAESMFYLDVVRNHLHRFDKKDRLTLLLQAEISTKKIRALNFKEWLLLLKRYNLNYDPITTLKFIRRLFKNILHKK